MKKHKNLTESHLEAAFLTIIKSYNIPPPTQQHQFHPQRKWRFDFAWPTKLVAVEIQGVDPKQSSLHGPAHNSIFSMQRDYEKHNAAILLHWRILYFLGNDLEDPNTTTTIHALCKALNVTPTNNTSIRSGDPTLNDIRRQFDQVIDSKYRIFSS